MALASTNTLRLSIIDRLAIVTRVRKVAFARAQRIAFGRPGLTSGHGYIPSEHAMLKTGKQHLEGLRDGRVVYIGGEQVADVTTHPAFRHAAQTIANFYI